jgi:hypothetical protein
LPRSRTTSSARAPPFVRAEKPQIPQDFPGRGVFIHVEAAARVLNRLRVLETVLCLECGEIYSKPVGGGTVKKNPGCPECAYVGWIPLTLPAEPQPRLRSAEGRRRHRFARSH